LSFEFRVSPQAGRQIRAAAKWWIRNRTKAPTLLRDELEAAYGLIDAVPRAGQSVPHARIAGLRRVLLGRTQYHLYYVVAEDERAVDILALWHTSRGKGPPLKL
jgi:plasmid stabilization system protein ParE